MKEADAKQKWCPMEHREEYTANCLASGCMMWRVNQQRLHRPYSAELEINRLGPDWKLDPIDSGYIINNSEGFCGLAGKP